MFRYLDSFKDIFCQRNNAFKMRHGNILLIMGVKVICLEGVGSKLDSLNFCSEKTSLKYISSIFDRGNEKEKKQLP